MERNDIIDRLQSLARLDIDAANAYAQAIKEIDIPIIRAELEKFKDDHDRHFYALSEEISSMGGNVPKKSPDIKGFFISGFTFIRSQMGNVSALKAMETNEKLTNKSYSEAVAMDFPEKILSLLELNYEDEKQHLQYVQTQIRILSDNPQYYKAEGPETRKRV